MLALTEINLLLKQIIKIKERKQKPYFLCIPKQNSTNN